MAVSKRDTSTPEVDPFKQFFPVGEAIAILLHPLAEVVLHDLRTGRIIRIWNSFTDRQAGDLSRLSGAEDSFPSEQMILGPYEKALASQGRTKSITSRIHDAHENLIGFLCINVEVTLMDTAAAFLSNFASSTMKRPEPFYRNDLQQHVNDLVRDFSLKVNKPVAYMSRAERAELLVEASEGGLFQGRNAVSLLAKAMHISRASVYNILAEIKAADQVAGESVAAALMLAPPSSSSSRFKKSPSRR